MFQIIYPFIFPMFIRFLFSEIQVEANLLRMENICLLFYFYQLLNKLQQWEFLLRIFIF